MTYATAVGSCSGGCSKWNTRLRRGHGHGRERRHHATCKVVFTQAAFDPAWLKPLLPFSHDVASSGPLDSSIGQAGIRQPQVQQRSLVLHSPVRVGEEQQQLHHGSPERRDRRPRRQLPR